MKGIAMKASIFPKRCAPFLLALLASSAFAYRFGINFNNGPLENEGLVVKDSDLNFGAAWATKNFPWNLRIENTTNKPVVIRHFETSCTCISIVPKSLTLEPGKSSTLNLTLDLAPTRVLQRSAHSVDITISPLIKDAAPRQKGWHLQGIVRSPIHLESMPIDFGEIMETAPPKTVLVNGTIPLKDIKTVCTTAIAHVQTRRLADDGTKFAVTMTLKTGLPLGPLDTRIQLQATGSDDTDYPSIEVPVVGTVRSDVQFFPSCVSFGSHPLGQIVEEVILPRSQSGELLEVISVDGLNADLSVKPVAATKTVERSPKYRIVQRIAKPGRQLSMIRFLIRRGNNNPITIPLEISYYGSAKAN